MILILSFHSLRKECLGLQPPFFVLNTKKDNGLQIMSLAADSSKTNKPLLLNKPSVSIRPPPPFPSNVFEIKKPPGGGLIEDLQYMLMSRPSTLAHKLLTGLSLRAGGWGFSAATKRGAPSYFYWKNRTKIEPKEIPSGLIPRQYLLYLPGNLKS